VPNSEIYSEISPNPSLILQVIKKCEIWREFSAPVAFEAVGYWKTICRHLLQRRMRNNKPKVI